MSKKYFSERFKQLKLGTYHRAQRTYKEEYGPVFHVVQNGKTGCIDSNGVIQIPLEFDVVNYSDADYFVSKGGLIGVYDSSFQLTIPFRSIKPLAK